MLTEAELAEMETSHSGCERMRALWNQHGADRDLCDCHDAVLRLVVEVRRLRETVAWLGQMGPLEFEQYGAQVAEDALAPPPRGAGE